MYIYIYIYICACNLSRVNRKGNSSWSSGVLGWLKIAQFILTWLKYLERSASFASKEKGSDDEGGAGAAEEGGKMVEYDNIICYNSTYALQ